VSEVSTRSPVLAHVLGDRPAAVLLVELTTGTVVSTNAVAREMAPDLPHRATFETWTESVGLLSAGGDPLPAGDTPMSQFGQAEPGLGVAVSVTPTPSSAPSRELRWLVALPVSGAPGLAATGLVMLFSVRTEAVASDLARPDPEQPGPTSPPVLATGLSYTVADARSPDTPLVWVSPGFTLTTGYHSEDVLGRNCRFLQGPHTSSDTVGRLRLAVSERSTQVQTVLNYTKGGTPFWNQVTLSPIADADGTVTHIVGVQNDVTGRLLAERERDAALDAARRADAAAADAAARLEALAGTPHSLSTMTGGVQFAARYLPAREALGAGADFFDVHELTRDHVSLVIGDVLGRDVQPSRAIAQVQGMVAALASIGDAGPAAILERVDLVASSSTEDAASLYLADLTRVEDGWVMRSSSAGHPPVVVVHPDGRAELLVAPVGSGHEPPVGLHHGRRSEQVTKLEEGTTVIAFSDGLVKRRSEHLDTGIDRLLGALASAPSAAVDLVDHLVDTLTPEHLGPPDDDVVVLALGLGTTSQVTDVGGLHPSVPLAPTQWRVLGRTRPDVEVPDSPAPQGLHGEAADDLPEPGVRHSRLLRRRRTSTR